MKARIIPILLFGILLFTMCKKEESDTKYLTMILYKFKGDYLNKSCIVLSSDKSKIIGIPTSQDTSLKGLIYLKNGYIMEAAHYFPKDHIKIASGHTWGLNSAYVSTDRKDWLEKGLVCDDSLMSRIIDKDPFVEFYLMQPDSSIKDTSIASIEAALNNGTLGLKNGFLKLK